MDEIVEVVRQPWDRLEKEPPDWYHIFKDYYLILGEARSIRNAFEFYLRVEAPNQYKDTDPDNIKYIPEHWAEMANKFQWASRAMAFEESVRNDFSQLYVNIALNYLREHAMDAAQALVQALGNDRTRVQAANSILNRAGVPESTEVLIRAGVVITSDDMQAAREKVDEWKTKRLSG